jgi:HAD superfamily hydrolase (TIGR01509 family)
VRAVSFDLDNTLVDRDAAARAWWAARLREVGATSALDEVLERDAGGHAPREPLFSWASARFGLGDGLWDRFRAEIPAFVVPDPRVGALLDRLRGRYRVGVLTNGGGALQRAKLAAAGLADRVDAVIVSEEIGVRKPAGAAFAAIRAALGVAAAGCLHVGDQPVDDVAGAQQAGLAACWVGASWPGPGPAPARRIAHVLALPEVLAC